MKKSQSIFPTKSNWFRWLRTIILGIVLTIVIYNGWRVNANYIPDRIIVYAASSHEQVLTQGIFPAFKQIWKIKTGQDCEIEAIFGPSASLAGQIVLSAPADVALFSNPYHVEWLKLWRMVEQESQPIAFGYSPIVIVTRTNNPIGIRSFQDLTLPGVSLVHGDPRTSGGGEWGVLAEYGSALFEPNNPSVAKSQLQNIWKNVRWVGLSAQEALTIFELGAGDALITYEHEARQALERGVQLEIVTPTHTIVSQHVAVIVDKNVTRRDRVIAQAFVDFLVSPAGQEILSTQHLRQSPHYDGEFTKLRQPFMVEDLGGWKSAYKEVIETIWKSDIEPLLTLDEAPLQVPPGE
jgi:sulfate/thiosulfate transport system substrate-binding protein